MKRTVYSCNICKQECDEKEVLQVWFALPESPGMKVLSQRGLMQGTRLGDEDLCPECYQKLCWAFANLITGDIVPINPVKESA